MDHFLKNYLKRRVNFSNWRWPKFQLNELSQKMLLLIFLYSRNSSYISLWITVTRLTISTGWKILTSWAIFSI